MFRGFAAVHLLYYVPNEPLQAALCASARRLSLSSFNAMTAALQPLPAAATTPSYFTAGVQIYKYVGGLVHTKSLTLDGEISFIGSAKMDRRSFELSYENSILTYNSKLSQQIRQRQQHYLDSAVRVDPGDVAHWPRHRRLTNNTIAMLEPIL